MKNSIIIILFFLITNILFSQNYGFIPYEFKLLDNETNKPLISKLISCKIDIIRNSSNGEKVYSERHNTFTNENGIVNINIGNGITDYNFSLIDWKLGPYYVKISYDKNAGSNFIELSTTQLMATPNEFISKTAEESILPTYSQEQIDELSARPGMLIYNSTYQYIQFYTDNNWVGLTTTGCVPKPIKARAGDDQFGITSESAELKANLPNQGAKGKWRVVSGVGGNFSDINSPYTTFTGEKNATYTLRWIIYTSCDSTYDDLQLSFWFLPPSVNFKNSKLFIHPTDNPYLLPWGIINLSSNAKNENDGKANTKKIINKMKGEYGMEYAAKVCESLDAYGFKDWYLPSKEELNAIYVQLDSTFNFKNQYYWSSTESDENNAWYQHFGTGGQYNYRPKYVNLNVRCVRREK